MKIFILDPAGNLVPVDGKGVVIELNNGKTLEIADDIPVNGIPEGINLWGGREPSALAPEERRAGTESLGVYPIAANALHIFPYRLPDGKQT
ncbi:hypothetical protein AAY84_23900 [Serratia marcescens]|uniref:hypothetical protein n=1 Tax=Serratia marcescens TaxID=615 RepID=UPI00062C813C|nr:hypothetical protein [Serratia marcescens]KKZ15832.1 hypothetical protein AAY84_23900 [Serratia marcescens]